MKWRDCTIKYDASAVDLEDNTLYMHYKFNWFKQFIWRLI